MRGRVSFGLSLAFKFDVYLLDEVTATGDLGFKKKCIKSLKELQNYSSFIIVSKDYEFLKRNIDKAYILRNKTLKKYDNVDLAFKDFMKILIKRNFINKENIKKVIEGN